MATVILAEVYRYRYEVDDEYIGHWIAEDRDTAVQWFWDWSEQPDGIIGDYEPELYTISENEWSVKYGDEWVYKLIMREAEEEDIVDA